MTTHHSIYLNCNNLDISLIFKAYITMLIKPIFIFNPVIFSTFIYTTITIIDYFDIIA